MNHHGAEDPRIIQLCHAYARIGFACYVPDIPSIRGFQFDLAAQRAALASACEWVKQSRAARFSLFGASFSAAHCLRVANMPGLRDAIKAMWILGPYYDCEQVQLDLIHGVATDDYAFYIIAYNLCRANFDWQHPLMRTLHHGIIEAHRSDVLIETQALLEALDDDTEREFLRGIIARDFDAERFIQRHQAAIDALTHASDYREHLASIQAAVAILHSASDNIILPSHSLRLDAQLQALGIKARCLVSPLLDHADLSLGWQTLIDAGRLVKLMTFFLQHAMAP